MKITLLGTGSPIPDPNRAGPSTLVQTADAVGARRLRPRRAAALTAAGLSAADADRGASITHLHSDHITDLNDVITTHWVMSPTPTPLQIYGPPRTAGGRRRRCSAMLGPDIEYRLAHHADLNAGARSWR